MIANFTMYARPETEAVIADFWTAIHSRLTSAGIDSPSRLFQDQSDMFAIWESPDLVLSQTCGFPYAQFLHQKVTLIGTPDFAVKGCPPGYYRSAFVVRKTDKRQSLSEFSTGIFAYNEDLSQSGFNAPLSHAARSGVAFPRRVKSGGHLVSAALVARGDADIAALDAVTWRLIQKHDAMAGDLRVLEWTDPPTPALPLISAKGADGAGIFRAVEQAIDDLAPELNRAFGLRGLVKISKADYLAVPIFKTEAEQVLQGPN